MDELDKLCATIVERCSQRADLQRAEIRLTLQLKAICRRFVKGDVPDSVRLYSSLQGKSDHPYRTTALAVTQVLLNAREDIRQGRLLIEAQLEQDVRALPIWPRVKATHGLGFLGVALLIGATGDLRRYSNHSKVWKRLGLAVIDGRCQRKVPGPEGVRQGFSPNRRSTMWNLGSNMLRTQSGLPTGRRYKAREPGPFRLGYDARKAYELANGLPKAHAHNRAKRYMEKKLVRNIWRAWREAGPALAPALAPA
ncbi:hypothetical protein IAE60_15030 [Pseudoxanthomonas mexicana]|uniref:IS110 family transposase n=1 Tax=Pseudoxanthomonas mexicana TaxID=128785 RepID=A0A7G9TAU7_PSEMX|nr:hypothetical protein [Pseudoxanthomonas mexicana]QNN77222.1 hypothetical protein IAE60_15030 [Pseudoxanthomonas mexicana]